MHLLCALLGAADSRHLYGKGLRAVTALKQVLAAKLFSIKLCYLSATTWHLYRLLVDGRSAEATSDSSQVQSTLGGLRPALAAQPTSSAYHQEDCNEHADLCEYRCAAMHNTQMSTAARAPCAAIQCALTIRRHQILSLRCAQPCSNSVLCIHYHGESFTCNLIILWCQCAA